MATQMPPVAQFKLPTSGQQPQQSQISSPTSGGMPPVAQFSLPGTSQGVQGGGSPYLNNNAALQAAKDIGNFVAPAVSDVYHDIKGDSTKSGLQQVGDVGLTALSALPFVGMAGKGLEAAGLLAKGAEATNVGKTAVGGAQLATGASKGIPGLVTGAAKGVGYGYGVDVSSNLSQGKTSNADVFTPGLGTVTGGLLGGVASKASSILDKMAVKTPESQLTAQTQRLKTLQKSFADNSTANTNPIKTLQESGLIKGLKVNKGKIDASALTNMEQTGSIDNLIEEHSSQASDLIKSLPGTVPLEKIKNDVITAIENNPVIRDAGKIPQAEAEIERRFSSYKRSFGDQLSWPNIDNIRAAMNREYDPALRDVARTIGDGMRTLLYNGSGTNTAIKSAMANEAELIKAQNFIEKLHGTTVPGGSLGKYFADLIGAGVGNAIGSLGGPIIQAGGTVVGGAATNALMNKVQSNYFNPMLSRVAGIAQKTINNPFVKAGAGLVKTSLLRGAKGLQDTLQSQ